MMLLRLEGVLEIMPEIIINVIPSDSNKHIHTYIDC